MVGKGTQAQNMSQQFLFAQKSFVEHQYQEKTIARQIFDALKNRRFKVTTLKLNGVYIRESEIRYKKLDYQTRMLKYH